MPHLSIPTTRLAPSPTGALHLGNARTFLLNWAMARRFDWRIVLRIDDLDGPRIKASADRDAIDILGWLGIDYDEGPFYQTQARDRYASAWRQLAARGLIYPCHCTRSQIQAASLSAPQEGDHELRYPGTCRPAQPQPLVVDDDTLADTIASAAWRLRVPDEPIAYVDQWRGAQSSHVQREVGDFLVFTRQGTPAYQLAVVCDDDAQAITHVVRGDDLLASTARQRILQDFLGIQPLPLYWHFPLVVGPDGRRLAKRHGDSRIAAYRDAGVPATRILGLLAEWSGLGPREEMNAREFARRLDVGRIPRTPLVFTAEDHAWLTR